MSKVPTEQRVVSLESQVAALKAPVGDRTRTKDWRRTVGMFAGDEVMKRILDGALKYREADRQRARRRFARSRRTKR